MPPYFSYEVTLTNFVSLLLLPASDRSCLHGGRQCRKLHLVNRQQIQELKSHEMSAMVRLLADQIHI